MTNNCNLQSSYKMVCWMQFNCRTWIQVKFHVCKVIWQSIKYISFFCKFLLIIATQTLTSTWAEWNPVYNVDWKEFWSGKYEENIGYFYKLQYRSVSTASMSLKLQPLFNQPFKKSALFVTYCKMQYLLKERNYDLYRPGRKHDSIWPKCL